MAGKVVKVLGAGFALLSLGVGGVAVWAKSTVSAASAKTYEVADIELPVPWPLSDAELEALRLEKLAAMGGLAADPAAPVDPAGAVLAGADVDPLAGVDLAAIARGRALQRGEHLATARYGCFGCHGPDFGGGGKMFDAFPIGQAYGANLTQGAGSAVKDYTPSDWNRIVRHGVKTGNLPTVMPSGDYRAMSDQELSDIITYITSLPPVDREVPKPTFGPVMTMLIATGKVSYEAEKLAGLTEFPKLPPAGDDQLALGEHLSKTCSGCHREDFSGGPITAGDPAWGPAKNLTPGPDGTQGWTYEQFVKVMREGTRHDGTPLLPPMNELLGMTKLNTDAELAALWAYFQSLPATPTGE